RRKRVVRKGVDLGVVAAVLEMDQRIARNFFGETRAAIAQDAPLSIEEDDIADRYRLLEVPFLLDETRLTRTVGIGVVLQWALAPLVAHRAVERVVDEQE